MLCEAQDPATPADKLEWLAMMMELNLTGNHRGHFSRAMEGETDHLARATEIMAAVASNPNADAKTLAWLATYHAAHVLDNPVLPLLVLEGDWSAWSGPSIAALRKTAWETGHPLFPVLAGVCRPEWRYTEWHERTATCHHDLCAVCRPQYAQHHLIHWREHAQQSATP